jgi:hypothetical protein
MEISGTPMNLDIPIGDSARTQRLLRTRGRKKHKTRSRAELVLGHVDHAGSKWCTVHQCFAGGEAAVIRK